MLPITQRLLDNYNRPGLQGRMIKQLKAIIIHYTANSNRGAGAIANRNYFNTKPYIRDRNGNIIYASAHYIVDDKNIIQCIPDNEVAYHVGARSYKPLIYNTLGIPQGDSPNNYTIGIEICVNVDSDFNVARQNTVELTDYLLRTHNLTIQQVYRHYDITGKNCPAMMIEQAKWQAFLDDVAQVRLSTGTLRVNTATLNVRAGAGTNFPIKRQVKNGDILQKQGQDGIWYKIGEDEWVHSNYVLVV